MLERSRELARPLHRPLVLPYVGLTVVARALGAAKGALLAAIPSRWVRSKLTPLTLAGRGHACRAGLTLARLRFARFRRFRLQRTSSCSWSPCFSQGV